MQNETFFLSESKVFEIYNTDNTPASVTTQQMYQNIKTELTALQERYPHTFSARMHNVFASMAHKTFDYSSYGSCFYNRFSYWNEKRAKSTSITMQNCGCQSPYKNYHSSPYTRELTRLEEYGLALPDLTTDMLKACYAEMIGETPQELNPYNLIVDSLKDTEEKLR